MSPLRCLWLCLPLVGCATVGRAHVAEQMGCPEDEIEPVSEGLEGEDASREALLRTLTGVRSTPAQARQYRGCDQTWECVREQCEETAGSKTARLTRALPALMERSREALVPEGHSERTRLLSWRLSSPSRGSTDCFASSENHYHCDPQWTGGAGVSGP